MRLAVMNHIAPVRYETGVFRGLWGTEYVPDGGFADMRNMSGAQYPLLCTREKRARVASLSASQGALLAINGLLWADGGQLFHRGEPVCALSDGKKQLVAMGALAIVLPDKIAYNTADGTATPLEATFSGEASWAPCTQEGGEMEFVVSDNAPTGAKNGDYWLDTSGEEDVLRVYSAASGLWASVPTAYFRLSAAGIGAGFSAGDVVEMTEGPANGAFLIESRSQDSLVFAGLLSASGSGMTAFSRSMPEMDFVFELNNRLWGCSSDAHEVYASKLGDPTNWRFYQGLSTDSYTATVGTPGPFTGACAHGGAALFFKEGALHKMQGTRPANFSLTTTSMRGVAEGCAGSLCVLNETLYYKSPFGVCAYDGGLPSEAGEALGEWPLTEAVAGALDGRYYLSVVHGDGRARMLALEEKNGYWYEEDDARAVAFAREGSQLYFLDDKGAIWAVRGAQEKRENPQAEWEEECAFSAETGDLFLETAGAKHAGRCLLRAEVDAGAFLRLEIEYDSSGTWERRLEVFAQKRRNLSVPLTPRRCDHVRLRLSGRGNVRVWALGQEIVRGSENWRS